MKVKELRDYLMTQPDDAEIVIKPRYEILVSAPEAKEEAKAPEASSEEAKV